MHAAASGHTWETRANNASPNACRSCAAKKPRKGPVGATPPPTPHMSPALRPGWPGPAGHGPGEGKASTRTPAPPKGAG
eukprot:6073656-Alexandrium_andersonii.AAC.1